MSSAEPETDPLIGLVIEKYVIQRRLGAGGMGVVYLARHESLGNPAAIKTLNVQSLQDPVALQRFLREAQALARVQDEGLVHIQSVGTLPDGRPYILMEFLDGQTLATHLANSEGGRLSVEQALQFTAQIATTLGKLHARHIVHRDIKPANIMVVQDPAVQGGLRTKLLDLGIAKLLEANSDVTRNANQVPGTPAYMAPECCEGEPADGKADVYSLGCVLYQMLCGRTPYLEDGGNMLAKHVFQRPVPPHRQTKDIPRAVGEFVLELLARYPTDRLSAEAVAERAAELLAFPTSTAWRGRWLRRRLWQYLRPRGLGMQIAYLASMPLFLLSLLILAWPDWCVRVVPAPWLTRLLVHSSVVRVPGGTFISGTSGAEKDIVWGMAKELDARYPQEQGENTRELADNRYLDREAVQRTVSLPTFLIDRYEVTNERFAQFLNKQFRAHRLNVGRVCPRAEDRKEVDSNVYVCDSNGTPYKNLFNDPRYGGISFNGTEFVAAPGSNRRPVVAVTWQAATDFCAASGMRLPTETEWEYVAHRGGRRFPWGDRLPSCQDAVLERKRDSKLSHCAPNEGDVLPDVGSMPNDKSEDGVFDMGGSVMEWTLDWFVEKLPGSDKEIRSPLVDSPPSNEEKPSRVLRGGGWTESVLSARGGGRSRGRPESMNTAVGFRCVRELR